MPLNKETEERYLKPSNRVRTNDYYWIELIELDNSSWNHLSVCKLMSSDSFKSDVSCKQYKGRNKIWYQIIYKCWYAIKHNQTKEHILMDAAPNVMLPYYLYGNYNSSRRHTVG